MSETQIRAQNGEWLNSYMVGANSYRLLSDGEETAQNYFEPGLEPYRRTGTEHRYARVQCRGSSQELWLVPIRLENSKLLSLSEMYLELLSGRALPYGFHLPFDLISDHDTQGYVMRPIPREAWQPIRSFLPKADAPRWQLAEALFRRVEQLHENKLTLNGFSREQVWVTAEQEIVLVVGETVSPIDKREPAYRGGFSALPETLEYALGREGIRPDGVLRDIFSAAVMAFYLLFYTHPFIGESFGQLLRDQYGVVYQNRPDYIFDPDGKNGPGHMELGREVSAQWERTTDGLKGMFNQMFLDLCHPERMNGSENALWRNAGVWHQMIREDAAKNDNEQSRSRYNFQMEKLHQV